MREKRKSVGQYSFEYNSLQYDTEARTKEERERDIEREEKKI
jgi:hypothetical protein